jgi:two-component system chemotaxis sensor kinase CheA
MAFDQLAAAVVTMDVEDLPQLGRIATLLEQAKAAAAAGSPIVELAQRAIACVESIVLHEPDAPARRTELGQLIMKMQQCEENISPLPEGRGGGGEGEARGAQGEDAIAGPPPPHPDPLPQGEGGKTPAAATDSLASDPALMAEFVAESLDHVTASEAALLALETDPNDKDAINAVFRAFHTIKGTSGFLNLTHIQALAHKAETLLDRARGGQIRLIGGYADLALESADALKQMIEASADGQVLPADADLLDRLADPEKAGVSESATDALPVPRVGDLLVSTGKADRETVETVVAAKGEQPTGQALIKAGAASASDVAGALRSQKRLSGESADNSVRVSTQRLDGLVNLVGELVIMQAMLTQSSVGGHGHGGEQGQSGESKGNARTISQMGKITRELQDLSMSLRMVPLKSTFQKMARLVRDLCRKSGKQVQFATEGEDTEIDRGMVESLNDPLVHLIRNAIDHGIETPEARRSAGKSPAGTVTLRAFHAAGSVVIELCDDGAGLNRDKILSKAIAKGLAQAGRDYSDAEVHRLIFAPGFSTADKVTDVSGRGVGMDVVRRNVEALRGRVEIATTQGKGATFSLRVPLTLAIIDGMLLRVGHERYVLPTMNIRQAFRPAAGAVQTVTGRGRTVLFRNQLVPVFSLGELFAAAADERADDQMLLVVVEDESGQCALAVDELLGQQQVVIKSLGEGMARSAGVSGGAILGDGRVGLILDVQGLIALSQGRSYSEQAA